MKLVGLKTANPIQIDKNEYQIGYAWAKHYDSDRKGDTSMAEHIKKMKVYNPGRNLNQRA